MKRIWNKFCEHWLICSSDTAGQHSSDGRVDTQAGTTGNNFPTAFWLRGNKKQKTQKCYIYSSKS